MRAQKWNENWKFWEEKNAFTLVWGVPEQAKTVTLPHDAMLSKRNPNSPNGGNTAFRDGGNYVYVKQFHAPGEWREQTVLVKFEGVYMNAMVYLNGQLVGKRAYGYSQFYVYLNDYLSYDGENELRVLVKNSNMPNSRWYSGGGICRDVWLLTGGGAYIEPDSLRVDTVGLASDYATLRMAVQVWNRDRLPLDSSLVIEIFDPKGEMTATFALPVFLKGGTSEELSQSCMVAHPALWSSDTPSLYRCQVRLVSEKVVLDSEEINFGVRFSELDTKQGLRVNGRSVKLRGACIHHDSGILGGIATRDVELRRVRILKEAGFNAIRMAHNPASVPLLNACDQLGMYVMDEAFDMWTRPKSDQDYSLFSDKWWQEDVTAMVVKDRPHPSVILYSLGNEIPEVGTPQGSSLGREMARLVKKLDPTRYIMVSVNGVFAAGDKVDTILADIISAAGQKDADDNVNDFMSAMDAHMDDIVRHPIVSRRLEIAAVGMDVLGYNYMTARYEVDAALYPHRVMVGSETYPPKIAQNWAIVEKLPSLIGDFTWTGWDYLGEAGVGIPAYQFGEGGFGAQFPCQLAYCGDIDITGYRRPASYFREIVFGLRSAPYITVQHPAHYGENLIKTPWAISDSHTSWSWLGFEGKPVVVEVYSPGSEVELILNGKSLGKRPAGVAAGFRVLFDTVYQPGTLVAVAWDKDQELGRIELTTAGTASSLRLEPENELGELIFVNITLHDQSGLVADSVDMEVQVTVSGDGQLIALGSGDPKPCHNYEESVTHTFHGRAQAILRRIGPGEIEIKAETDTGIQAALNIAGERK